MSDAYIHRDLGGFEARLLALEISVAHTQKSVDELNEVLQNLKGGWKTLIWIGGALSLIVANSHNLFDFIAKVMK